MNIQMAGVSVFGPKTTGETKVLTFDFSAQTAVDLAGASEAVIWAGGTFDANPSAILSGALTISGQRVLRAVTGGLAGAVYIITTTGTDLDGGVHTLSGQLVVVDSNAIGSKVWEDFAPWVLDHAKQCPIFTIVDQLRYAAREFFRESAAWRSDNQSLLTTTAGVSRYQLPVQANADVNLVHSAWIGSTEINVEVPGDEADTEPGKIDSIWALGVEPGSIVRLTPTPETSGQEVTGIASYVPARWALGIPEPLYERWGRAIAKRAAAELVAQGARPWSNPGAYAVLMSAYDDAVQSASDETGPVRRRGMRVRQWP